MPTILDLPLFVLYSLAGTSAAAFGKAALHQAHGRAWFGAVVRAAAALGAFGVSFALLFVLLGRIDMSIMVPISVGLNLLLSAVLSIAVFAERIDRWKAIGMTLIAGGVVLLSVGA